MPDGTGKEYKDTKEKESRMLFYLLMLTVTVLVLTVTVLMLTETVLMLTMSVLMLPVTVLMLPVWPEFHN